MDIVKNSEHEVEIISMTSEGNGVARIDGFAVFIPNTAIGDIAKIKIMTKLKSYATGMVLQILKRSEQRCDIDCRVFSKCGGCGLRHIKYQAELDYKKQLVKDSFARLGGFKSINVHNCIENPSPTRYRNKEIYAMAIKDSRKYSGFFMKNSHLIVECDNCLLEPEIFTKIRLDIMQYLNDSKILVYNYAKNNGIVRHIYLRHATSTGQIMVCLVINAYKMPKEEGLIEMLTSKYPEIASIELNHNYKDTNVALGNKCTTIYGKGYIEDTICGIDVKISPLSFYQVNKTQAEALYNKAIELADIEQTSTVVDLYCGTGTIGLIASKKAKKVIGVELFEQAVIDARDNAIANGVSNSEFICGDATVVAQQLVERNEDIDVVIVDPPRKGLTVEVVKAILDMSPERVVMVSCNPATSARDCKLLCEDGGYNVEQVVPVDMFSRTVHVECVALMSKIKK